LKLGLERTDERTSQRRYRIYRQTHRMGAIFGLYALLRWGSITFVRLSEFDALQGVVRQVQLFVGLERIGTDWNKPDLAPSGALEGKFSYS